MNHTSRPTVKIEVAEAKLRLASDKPFEEAKAELLAKFPDLQIIEENAQEGWIVIVRLP